MNDEAHIYIFNLNCFKGIRFAHNFLMLLSSKIKGTWSKYGLFNRGPSVYVEHIFVQDYSAFFIRNGL